MSAIFVFLVNLPLILTVMLYVSVLLHLSCMSYPDPLIRLSSSFFVFLRYPDPSSTHVIFSKSYSDPSCIFCLRAFLLQQLSPMTVSFALLCATAMWFMLIFPIILFHFLFFFTLGALYTDDFYFMGMHCSLDIWACANIALRGLFLLLL